MTVVEITPSICYGQVKLHPPIAELPTERSCMLSVRLVRMIEDHAEELTRGVLNDLQSNTRTRAYHKISREELHRRVYEVYHNFGEWLGSQDRRDD